MTATTLLRHPALAVIDYRCTAGLHARPYVEQHRGHSLAFVRKGSFGYRSGGRLHGGPSRAPGAHAGDRLLALFIDAAVDSVERLERLIVQTGGIGMLAKFFSFRGARQLGANVHFGSLATQTLLHGNIRGRT